MNHPRIGQGVDVHAFGPGDHVILGGVRIAHNQGLLAHSDGDVVLHALCDAILGALALGDIGRLFPPGEARWRDADSRGFLRRVRQLAAETGYVLGNADVTVVCEAPKIAPHAEAMRMHIAADLSVGLETISIKATTSEGLGFAGRGEGIAAFVSVLMVPHR
jgi:2-C-methyl-D-erythritol 2,4-cyclodiphosphate synthase